jgi:predicted transposase YdaD
LRAAAVPDSVERGLLGSTFVLCGLRYDPARIEALYRDLSMTLEDSTTYQLILSKGEARGELLGRVAEAQALVLRLGVKRFGPASGAAEAAVRAITDREHLARLAERVLDAAGWDEVLATR